DYLGDLARFNFEAEQAAAPDVARARVEAVRTAYAAALRGHNRGRDVSSLVLELGGRLLQAELAARGEEGAVPAAEQGWRRAWHDETLHRARDETIREGEGIVLADDDWSAADTAELRFDRLEAQAALLRARRTGPPSGFGRDVVILAEERGPTD